jgi:hypothetical protein
MKPHEVSQITPEPGMIIYADSEYVHTCTKFTELTAHSAGMLLGRAMASLQNQINEARRNLSRPELLKDFNMGVLDGRRQKPDEHNFEWE